MEFKQLKLVEKRLNELDGLKKIRVISTDQFSFCTEKKELELSSEKIAQVEGAMLSGRVFHQFKDSIHYEWVITEVELLN